MSDASQSTRMAGWEWAQVALLAGNLGWTTFCLGGYRPETMIVTSALTGALLVCHLAGAAWRAWRGEVVRFHPAGWLLLPFLAYAAANVGLISPVPWLGWLDWLVWAQLIAVFWVVLNGVRSRAPRAALFAALALIGFGAVVLACYQRFVRPDWLMLGRTQAAQFIGRASGPFGIPNSLAALLLLLLPATLAFTLRRGASAVQRVLGGYVAAVFALGLVLTVSRGAWLALGLALAAWPLWAGRGRWRRRLGLSAAIGGGLVLFFAGLYASVPIVRERLVTLQRDRGEVTRPIMWRGAWAIFRAHPVWGGGGGSYDVLFEAHRPERYQDEPRWAHNDYLNTLSDYGAAGFVLFFGATAAIVWQCGRRRGRGGAVQLEAHWRREVGEHWAEAPAVIAALAVGLGAFALQLFVDFHFKIPALAMAAATVAALWVQRAWPQGAQGRDVGRMTVAGCALAGLAIAGGVVFWALPLYRGEALRYGARQAIDRLAREDFKRERWARGLSEAREALTRAVVLAPTNGAAWADLAYATVLSAHVAPARTPALAAEAERAAERALACAKVVPVFWVRRGVALDLQGRHYEAGRAFAEALRLAPNRASIWFNYAFHLGLQPAKQTLALGAVDFCLRLDPRMREAQALRQRLADRSRAP